ncbi:MAG: spermidine synthase [Syntrophaceae bacterium PtaU1.Bin231]|nr:MAG: spermidine synthase [Syntrophaceae bacterium PtaU1.Bin231]HOG16261.1 fused MFS/spermidine synthase [Syntrophales bacterium]
MPFRIRSAFYLCLLLILAAPAVAPAAPPADSVLYEGDSIYNHITIWQVNDERCMIFGRHRDLRQTCISLKSPDLAIMEYSSMFFGGFLFRPETEKVCLIGLGGGYIPSVFRSHLPRVRLDTVEVDPLVHRLAAEHFGFSTPAGHTITIDDGRQYLKKTGERYDQIWIDAFNSDYIPAHMTTKEFLTTVKSRLREHGIVAQNMFRSNRLFDAQVTTYREVFPHVFVFQGRASDNCIIFAAEKPSVRPEAFEQAAARLGGRIGLIDLRYEASKFKANPVVRKAPVLTDDFNPANLLLMEK